MNIVISKVTIDDVIEIQKCNKTVLPIYYTKFEYITFINNPECILLKASNENIFLGYIVGQLENTQRFHIITFGIYKEYRRQGIGKLLMTEITKQTSDKYPTVKFISLNVDSINESAINFYESCEFKKIVTLKDYYGLNKDGYTYAKLIK